MRSARCFKRLLWWGGVLLVLLASRAGMACSIVSSAPTAAFGSLSSLNVGTVIQQAQPMPNAGLRCPGSVLTLLSGNFYINATLASANSGRLRNAAGDTIGYQAYADNAGQVPLTLGTTFNYYNTGLLALLNGSVEPPMRFRTQPGTAGNVSAGTYTDTLTVSWSWRICPGIGALGLCVGTIQTGTGTSVITLSLTVSPDCAINSPNLDFGSAPLIEGFDPVTQTISIRCTKGSNYTVGISDGMHASGSQRRLEAGGNYLLYEIYQGVSSQTRWGQSGSARRSSGQADLQPGNYDGLSWQGFTYRAEILPNQSTPPPATYTDTLVVDVAF